jgi:CubicO group peptidase (beta-lactamase class C family)
VSVADLYDWPSMIARLERQPPHWPPGSAVGYHAVLWGFLPGELALRLTGKSLGTILRERLAEPLDAEFHLGLPAALADRVAPVIGPNRARVQPDLSALANLEVPPLYALALQNPVIRPFKDASSAPWQRAELAAANGQANARGIARIYAAAAMAGESGGLFRPETLEALTAERVGTEPDLVLGRGIRRGAGVILNTDGAYGPYAGSFGHAGAGGSLGFADPERRLAFGYAMNQMQTNLDEDSRSARLIRAVYGCLGEAPAR